MFVAVSKTMNQSQNILQNTLHRVIYVAIICVIIVYVKLSCKRAPFILYEGCISSLVIFNYYHFDPIAMTHDTITFRSWTVTHYLLLKCV